jgi:hypothetical protein
VQVKDVARNDAECQFEQGDGDPQLDGEHRGDQDHGPEHGC